MTEKAVAALLAEKARILAEQKTHEWTPQDTAWHRAFGTLSGINLALALLVDGPLTAGKLGT